MHTPPPLGRAWIALILLITVLPMAAADSQATEPAIQRSPAMTWDGTLSDLGDSDPDVSRRELSAITASRDSRALPLLNDYITGTLALWKGRVVLVSATASDTAGIKTATLADPITRLAIDGATSIAMSDIAEIAPSRKERQIARDATTVLRLFDANRDRRLAAVVKAGESADATMVAPLAELLAMEADAKIRFSASESTLLITLTGCAAEDIGPRVNAAITLGAMRSSRALSTLQGLAAAKDTDPLLRGAATSAVARIQSWQHVAQGISYVFSGLSQGSILVLMALGLSIVFGLMGVINMAHGELMMIGAYATYLTQQVFSHLPVSAFDWYFAVAIPVSFAVSATVGLAIETLIVRHLYGRPLETLLATWGVSLILIQAVRIAFGDNIAVNSPSWLQGGAEVAQDVVLPYNRLFIIGFCFLCIVLMYALIEKTRLGLLLRATTQNRRMASSLGVATRRIDGFTFALGSGLAGMAGCALTQIGGVTPDMGQNYIVDSFMVVVAGGVGKLAGAIWAGLGLGCLDKVFEPIVQAVWAKVLILGCVVMLLQWRPSGLFPAKGRLADV